MPVTVGSVVRKHPFERVNNTPLWYRQVGLLSGYISSGNKWYGDDSPHLPKVIWGTGKTSENGQNSRKVGKTVGYDIGKPISGVANDWVARRRPKSFWIRTLNVQSDFRKCFISVSGTLSDQLN